MKIVAQPIEMIAWFTKEGIPHPIRFRIDNEDSLQIIKVDKIILTDKEKIAGNHFMVFNCQSNIKGIEKIYQLKYETDTCKWILFKI